MLAHGIVSSDQVLIGVPETLREMSFDVIVDDFPEQRIKLLEPMKTKQLHDDLNKL